MSVPSFTIVIVKYLNTAFLNALSHHYRRTLAGCRIANLTRELFFFKGNTVPRSKNKQPELGSINKKRMFIINSEFEAKDSAFGY